MGGAPVTGALSRPRGYRAAAMSTHTRRGFLGAGAAVGAGALIGTPDAEAKPRKPKHKHKARRTRRVDVAVVGAGFAGLSAAWALVKAGKSVLILEAQNHVGGRCRNHALGGGEVSERGATFAGPTQNHILDLAKEMGVGTFPTFATGQNVYYADGQRTTYSDSGPLGTAPPDPLIVADLAQVVQRLDQMASQVPVDAPWTAPNAAEWDGQTFESWINANAVSPRFKQIVPVATRPIFGAEPRELSLLFVLFYIAASGDESHPGTFERNFNTRDGAQQFRFQGGSQRIALALAAALGKRVQLKHPVRRIDQAGGRVTVHCDKLTVKAKHAIVAVPPALAERIEYRPAMPAARDQLAQRLSQGTLLKVAAVYDKPFWRDAGLNGTAVSLQGPVNVVYDDSPEDGSPGVLFGFVGGDEARAFMAKSDADRRAAALGSFATYFGPQANQPTAYFETIWPANKWIRGGPVGIAPPGTLLAYGHALREPVGNIHWAGTESSTYWAGYMDGAVRSGQRAAGEVLAAL
jgi:monoamine oxidase